MQSFDKISLLVMQDAIMGKIQDGQQWPYLFTDGNQIWAGTTRSLGEHPRSVLKKSEERSLRR